MNTIVSYDDNNIVIRANNNEESSYSDDLIILPNKIISNYSVNLEHDADIAYLIGLKPEILIIANRDGFKNRQMSTLLFEQSGIGIEFIPLGAACRTYNLLALEGRQVVLIIQF